MIDVELTKECMCCQHIMQYRFQVLPVQPVSDPYKSRPRKIAWLVLCSASKKKE